MSTVSDEGAGAGNALAGLEGKQLLGTNVEKRE